MPDPNQAPASSYLVVARRYRPRTFDELIGQEHVAKGLKQAIATGRIGHAYLFTGARGVGKTSAARVLAKALNCVEGPTPEPCNKCEVCQSIALGDDVDVIEIDGASNRGIDEIRQLRQNVSVRPSRVPFKVYIIDEVHMLTKEAFNALLKTLEEPPEHVKFIFATTEANKIPITILSRCQRFDFAGIETESIERRLAQIAQAEGVEVDEDALALLANRAAGSMRDSQSLLEQLLAVAGNRVTAEDVYQMLGIASSERMAELVKALADGQASVALEQLDRCIAGGGDVGQLVDQLLGYLRDIMALVVGCDTSQLLYILRGQHAMAEEIGQRLGIHTVLAMIQILDQTAARMRVSVHVRTLAEMALVRICHLGDLEDLADALEEVRNGEEGAPSRGGQLKKKNSSPPPHLTEAAAPRAPQHEGAREPSPMPASPAAATVPPPSSVTRPEVSLTAATLAQVWQEVVADIEGLLATQLELAADVQLGGDGAVVLKFAPADAPSKEFCDTPNNRATIERKLAEHVGQSVAVRLEVDSSPSPATPHEVHSTAPRKSRRQLQAEVAERPIVSRAMELFAADASSLKVIPPSQSE